MPISDLKGVGKMTELLFKKLNITSVGKLLTFFPVDYEDWLFSLLITKTGIILKVLKNALKKILLLKSKFYKNFLV